MSFKKSLYSTIVIILMAITGYYTKIFWEPYYNHYFTRYDYQYPKQNEDFIVHIEPLGTSPGFVKRIIQLAFSDRTVVFDNNKKPNLIIRTQLVSSSQAASPEFNKCLNDKKSEEEIKVESKKKYFESLNPDERRAYTCAKTFGFKKGTDKFKDCVFQIYAAELELAKLEAEKQLAESQLELAKANKEAAEARAETAKVKKQTEQSQLDAAQALVEATNQQTAQMKANAKQAEMNAVMSILSQRLGTAGSGACSIVNGNLKCY